MDRKNQRATREKETERGQSTIPDRMPVCASLTQALCDFPFHSDTGLLFRKSHSSCPVAHEFGLVGNMLIRTTRQDVEPRFEYLPERDFDPFRIRNLNSNRVLCRNRR